MGETVAAHMICPSGQNFQMNCLTPGSKTLRSMVPMVDQPLGEPHAGGGIND